MSRPPSAPAIVVGQALGDIEAIAAAYAGPFVWLDAGIDPASLDLGAIAEALAQDGFFAAPTTERVADIARPETIAWLHARPEELARPRLDPSVVGFDPRRAGIALLIRTWARSAARLDDPAVLSLLAYGFQRAFGFALGEPGAASERLERLGWAREETAPPARPTPPRRRVIEQLADKALADARAGGIQELPRTLADFASASARVLLPPRLRVAVGLHAPPAYLGSQGLVDPLHVGPSVGGPRVAQIGPGLLPIPPRGWGAIERDIWNLHVRAAANGFDALVFNCRDPQGLVDLCEHHRPDLIHLHSELRFPALRRWLERHPTPLVLTSHAAWAQLVPPTLFEAAQRADTVIAISPSILERMRERGISNAVYLPNGVDTTVFRPLTKRPKSVAAVAANQRRKRLKEIAEFFRERPDYHLTICGPNTDTTNPDRALPRAPNITVLGAQPQEAVAKLLGESELFVHLAEIEASVLVVREAMAAGCRVWTVPYNAQDLTNVSLFWEDARDDVTLGERARREAVELHDWDHIARGTAEIYRETLRRRGRGGRAT